MTKSELYAEIKSKLNDSEIETLGVNARSSKTELENVFNQLPKEKNESFTEKTFEEILNSDETEKSEPIESEKIEPEPDDFNTLQEKIKNAEPGQPKEKAEKPLITKEKRKRKKGESSPESFRIEGYIFLLAIDTIYPTVLSVINNMIDKKHRKLTVTELQLSEKDFNKLEPLADQAADYMSVNINPIAGFFLVATFMYANNMIAIKMTDEK